MIFQQLLSSVHGGKILDVGCGSGQFTKIISESLKSFDTITGIDVAEEYLAGAKEKFNDNKYNFIVGSSMELPFEDESFDLVTISKALHHVEDPKTSLFEMKRVLKSGGFFLVNEMHRDQLTEAQGSHMRYHHLRSKIDNALGISHHHTFFKEDLIALIDELELKNQVALEFSPDASAAKEPDNIKEFTQKMDEWFLQLEGHPARSELYSEAAELKKRFIKYGISRPPQMVFLGRK